MVLAETAKMFSRKFRGYDMTAVEAHIEMLGSKQQLLHGDVESLRARLREAGDEAAELRKEVALLTDTSPSPHAMQQRMAKMLRRAVEEASEMQAEARAEADELIAAAEVEVAAERRKREELLADMDGQRKALETELAGMRAQTEAALEEARRDAQQEHEQLVEEAWQEVDEASRRRIKILEQLMSVHRDLETVPATLESAYRERDDQESDTLVAMDGKVRTG